MGKVKQQYMQNTMDDMVLTVSKVIHVQYEPSIHKVTVSIR